MPTTPTFRRTEAHRSAPVVFTLSHFPTPSALNLNGFHMNSLSVFPISFKRRLFQFIVSSLFAQLQLLQIGWIFSIASEPPIYIGMIWSFSMRLDFSQHLTHLPLKKAFISSHSHFI